MAPTEVAKEKETISPKKGMDKDKKRKICLLVLFLISGFAVICIGFWAEFKLNKVLHFTSGESYAASYVLMATGIIIILGGLCTYIWKARKGPILLYTCGVFLFVVVVLQISAAVAMLAFQKRWMGKFETGMKQAMTKYRKNDSSFDNKIDSIQNSLKCCGNRKYTDWLELNPPVPQSCCLHGSCDTNDTTKIYVEGCYEKVRAFLKKNVNMIAIMTIILTIFPLVGVIKFCLLAKTFTKSLYQQFK